METKRTKTALGRRQNGTLHRKTIRPEKIESARKTLCRGRTIEPLLSTEPYGAPHPRKSGRDCSMGRGRCVRIDRKTLWPQVRANSNFLRLRFLAIRITEFDTVLIG